MCDVFVSHSRLQGHSTDFCSTHKLPTPCPHSNPLSSGAQVTLDAIPVFYRGGGIIPRRERPRRSTATMARDPFTLVVALDQDGNAHGDLYVDDGRSLAFKKGHYLHRWVWQLVARCAVGVASSSPFAIQV